MNKIIIREIQQKDNQAIAQIVRDVLMELGAPKVGTAYADPNLDFLFESYQSSKSVYFVITTGPGGLDASPRGDAPGFIVVENETTLLLPERRGNNRADSLRNMMIFAFGVEIGKFTLAPMWFMLCGITGM